MSLAGYAVAVRDYLRSNLTNFYGSDVPAKNSNCRVMLNEKPVAKCGQEFIAIYGQSARSSKDYGQAIEEEFGLTVAISRKIASIPPDYRGELGYIDDRPIPPAVSGEELVNWDEAWKCLTERESEIVGMVVGGTRYHIMHNANRYIAGKKVPTTPAGFEAVVADPITEPLKWIGSDPTPQEVGPEHFWGYNDISAMDDPTFGLLMKIHFSGAVRIQDNYNYDRVEVIPEPVPEP